RHRNLSECPGGQRSFAHFRASHEKGLSGPSPQNSERPNTAMNPALTRFRAPGFLGIFCRVILGRALSSHKASTCLLPRSPYFRLPARIANISTWAGRRCGRSLSFVRGASDIEAVKKVI